MIPQNPPPRLFPNFFLPPISPPPLWRRRGRNATIPDMEATTATATAGDAGGAAEAKVFRFQFRGGVGEYFKIWAVNVSLTVATLGIFSAWAKVRKKRYFYANTFLDGANFEYHARPLSILLSRLILAAAIIGGGFWAGEHLGRNALHSALLAFLLPWALTRGLAFNARNSSHRNVRFAFARDYRRMYWVCAPIIAVYVLPAWFLFFNDYFAGLFFHAMTAEKIFYFYLALTAALLPLLPLFFRAYHRIKAEGHSLGGMQFGFRAPPLARYWAAPALFFLFILAAVGLFTGGGLIVSVVGEVGDGAASVVFIVLALLAYGCMLSGFLSGGVLLFILFWNGITFPGGRIRCTAPFGEFLFRIQLVNLAATLLSLGLLHPWAAVRKSRFLAEHLQVHTEPGMADGIFGRGEGDNFALAEELDSAEGLDFDVGLI